MQEVTCDDFTRNMKLHDKAKMVLQAQKNLIIRWMFILRCGLLHRKSNSTEKLLSFLSVLTKLMLKDQKIEDKNLYKDKFFITQFSKCMAEGITVISDEQIKNNLVLFSKKFAEMKVRSSLEILKNFSNFLNKINKDFFDINNYTFKQVAQLDELSKTHFDFKTQPSNRELEEFYLPSKSNKNNEFLPKHLNIKEWQSILSELELYDKIKLEKRVTRSNIINALKNFFSDHRVRFFLLLMGFYLRIYARGLQEFPENEVEKTFNYIWIILLIAASFTVLRSLSTLGYVVILYWINNLPQWHKNITKESIVEIDRILNDLFKINYVEIDEINSVENVPAKKFILKIEDKTISFPEEETNEEDANQSLPSRILKLPKIIKKRKHQRFSSQTNNIFQETLSNFNFKRDASRNKLTDIPQIQTNKKYRLTFAKKRFFADMIEKNGHLELDENSTNKVRKVNDPNNPNLLSSFMEKTLLKQGECLLITSLKEAYGSTHKDTNLNVIGEKGKQGIKHLFGDKLLGSVKWDSEETTQENYNYEYKTFKKFASGKRILFFSTDVDKKAISDLPIGLQQSGDAFKLLLPCLLLDKKQIAKKVMPAITLDPSDYYDANTM